MTTPLQQAQQMSDEELRIAVAEARGLHRCEDGYVTHNPNPETIERIPLPQLTLDEMHEAEKMLTDGEWISYLANLLNIIELGSKVGTHRALCHATARQRSIAFMVVKRARG